MVEGNRKVLIASHAVLIFGAALMIFPVYMAFVASTHTGADFLAGKMALLPGGHFVENYWTALVTGKSNQGLPPVGPMLLNSAVMAFAIAFGKIGISILSAFAICYFKFPFRVTAFWTIFITLMLPIEVRIMPTFEVVANLGLLNSYAGLTIPIIASATATFLFRQVFMTIPDELTEAARVDGATPLRFFWSILLPLSRTNVAALFVILFIYGWNQYLWPLMIGRDEKYYTVVMSIQKLAAAAGEGDPVWELVMATTILAMLPPVIVVVLMQKLFVKGLTETEK